MYYEWQYRIGYTFLKYQIEFISVVEVDLKIVYMVLLQAVKDYQRKGDVARVIS